MFARRSTRSATQVAVQVLVLALFATRLSAQVSPGEVNREQKISKLEGGFAGAIGPGAQFGRGVASIGDLDGDGGSDLVVGAHGDDDGGTDVGAAFILFMHPSGRVLRSQKIGALEGGLVGPLQNLDQFGRAVAGIGDLDLDGFEDVAVGAALDDDGLYNNGSFYVLFLNGDGTVRDEQKVSATQGGFGGQLDFDDEFGRSLARLEDMDGDGVQELAVGASYDDDGDTNAGAVWILFMNRDGTVKAEQKISATEGGFEGPFTPKLDAFDYFAHSLANLGDFNNDGIDDLVVGSVLDDDGGTNRGAIYILLLEADGTVKDSTKISDLVGGFGGTLVDDDQFGVSVSPVRDLDGDGIPEIAVGAVKDDDGGFEKGAVWVLLMNSNRTVKGYQKISDTKGSLNHLLNPADWFGSSVGILGGDPAAGFFDLAVGSRYDDDGDGNAGAVYLLTLEDSIVQPPVADFLASPVTGTRPLLVEFESNSSPDVISWSWDFGDGGTATSTNPAHTYASAGIYTVSLDVISPDGADTEAKLGLITVSELPPVAQFSADVTSGALPLSVTFSDLSSGVVTGWAWDFGDGELSTDQHPVHVYTGNGTFSVSLVASGPGGSDTETKTGYVSVYAPPVAGFTGSPTSGVAPLAVSFADASSGVVDTWAWDFGDGNTSNSASPSHSYTEPGLYEVSLVVTGPGGSDGETKPGYVSVQYAPPVAQFSATPTSGIAPLAVAFSGLSSGEITSHAWDFGDGGSSTLASPAHTFAAPGTYTVSLVVSGPGGSATETKADYVDAQHPAPVAQFSAAPTLGPLPLSVAFTDASTGTLTTWAWDFGDGSGSTSASPTHVFLVSGLYTVTLAVSGPGGADAETKVDLVFVGEAPSVGIADPSFEGLASEAPPNSPWQPFFGAQHLVKPDLAALDNGMPSDGAQWLEISASGTVAALPPSNPGGSGALPVGGAGVVQSFSLGSNGAKLSFEAAFLRDGAANDLQFNDWMSVDLSDGATAVNLYYADTFTPTPNVSVDHGLAMSAVTTVEADLVELFPEATLATVFSLLVQVGNGGDGLLSSKGYVDAFRLEHEPGSQVTYGCGVNPAGTLLILAGAPTLGTTLTLGVENPLGTQVPGTRSFLMVSSAPDPLYPCGTLRPSWGMSGPGAPGEFLLWAPSGGAVGSLQAPLARQLQLLVGPPWAGVGSPAPIDLAIADELGLAGTTIYVQGLLFDPAATLGVGRALTEAREIVLGH